MTTRRTAPRLRWCPFVLGVALVVLARGTVPAAAEDVVQIRITHRDAADVLAMVEPLVSPNGFISADIPSNSLIVIDAPSAVARIEALVAKIDQPAPQLKIRVQYEHRETEASASASAQGRVAVGDATVSVGGAQVEGVESDWASKKSRQQDRGEYILLVRSGNTAYIHSGIDVPYPDRWSRLSHHYGHTSPSVTFRKVDTGFDVRPLLVGETVQIEITPHIRYVDERNIERPVRFTEAATRLNVPLGEWVEIGATASGHEDIHRRILSGGRASRNAQMHIRLLVTRN